MSSHTSITDRILELLLTQPQVTRGQILEKYPMRPATLLQAVADLKDRGIVREPLRTGRSTGRRASPIELNPAYGCFVGIELDITHTTGVVIDTQGNSVASASHQTPPDLSADTARQKVLAVLSDLRKQMGARWNTVRGLGFADPGLVDIAGGVSLHAANVAGWRDLPTRQWLIGATGVPSLVVPATLARAFAEFVSARVPACTTLFHLELGEGIGGALIKNGLPFVGDHHCAMEIGHVVVRENGPLCQCGNRGCLEAVAGLLGLRKMAADLARHDVITDLTQSPFTIETFLRCVEARDKVACSMAADVCQSVGVGLAMLICILNPGVIVFSGPLTALGQPFLDHIRRVLASRCLPQAVRNLELRISTLGPQGTALGAAMMARRHTLLESSSLDVP